MKPSVGLHVGTVSLSKRVTQWLCLCLYVACLVVTAACMWRVSRDGVVFNLEIRYFEVMDRFDLQLAGQRPSQPSIKQLKDTFASRLALLERTCAKYSDRRRPEHHVVTKAVEIEKFYFLKKPNFLMCMIPKVASTSLSSFFLRNHQVQGGPTLGNLGFVGGIPFSDQLRDTYKVMVVRHPMERLLSAFLYIFRTEVLADKTHSNLFYNMSKVIVESYRGSRASQDVPEMLTFPEFVRFVVNGTSDNIKTEWHMPEKDPLFWLREDNTNNHWFPYWHTCTPCHNDTRPQKIIKMGPTFQMEVDYVFSESGIFDLLANVTETQRHLQWENPSKEGKADALRNTYYSQLNKRQVLELYHKYRVDHEMFGYSIEPYLSIAK